jgi:hypothetical protein
MIHLNKLLLLSLIVLGSNLSYANDVTAASNSDTLDKRTPIESQSFSRKKIYETKYFKIYYDKNSIEATKRLIEVADNIAEIEAKFMKLELPKKKIKIYVEDGRDDTNAYSSGNGIHLYINNIGLVSSEFKDWIPYLFSHELTHELLSYKIKDTGINKYIPLSDELVTSAAVPRWWTEGMAVLMESMISEGAGRTFAPEFLAIAKKDVNEDSFHGLGPNPGYNRAYEYGNSFLKFYLDTYGVEKSSEAIDYYAHNKFSNIGSAYAKVAGISGDELYTKWQDYLKLKISEKDVLEGGIVMNDDSSIVQIIRDKEDLYLYSVKKDEVRSKLLGTDINEVVLSKITLDYYGNLKTKEDLDKISIYSFGEIAITDGNLYYVVTKKSSIKGSLDNISYKIDLKTGAKTYLKDVKRATNFVAVGKDVYYSFNENGTQGISTLDGKTIVKPGNYQILYMTSTADGNLLVTAHTNGKIGTQIYEVNPKTKNVKFLVAGSDPYQVGNTLYYANNYGNDQKNIYKTTIGSDSSTQLTNVKYNAEKPFEINGTLFYANLAKGGYRLTRLGAKEQLNKTISISASNVTKQERYDSQLKLYGQYGTEYQSAPKASIADGVLENNNTKEISGFFYPTFSKPQIMWDTGMLSFVARSSNDKDILLLSAGVDSVYQGGRDVPVFSFDKDSDQEAKYNVFSALILHHFSEPELSKSLIVWSHSEKLASNDIAKKSNKRLSQDEILLQLPFRSDYLDAAFNVSTNLQGDLFGGDEKYQKLDTSFGIGDYDTGFIHESILKLGTIQRNGDHFDGNYARDTYYADTNLAIFLPFLAELSFFDLNARVEYASKEFSSDSSVLPELADTPKLDGVDNNIAVRNTYASTNIYGDFKYLYAFNHGTKFGKIYSTGILFKLGYTVVAYDDKNYKNTNHSASVVGVGLDPSITLIGNIFNDAGGYQLGIGHAFINSFANGDVEKDNKSYVTLRLMF